MTKQLKETIDQQRGTWVRLLAEAPAASAALAELLWAAPFQFCGCGTSHFVARSLAELQRAARAQRGLTPVSVAEPGAQYAPVAGWTGLFITRSGTTTEILQAMERARAAGQRIVLLSGAPGSPAARLADVEILLDFASDPGVIQARFVSSVLLLWRWLTGDPTGQAGLESLPSQPAAAELADAAGLEHFVVLGSDWRYGLAGAAALGLMETGRVWAEAWHPLEYRHGPLACADERTLVILLDPRSPALEAVAADVRATGARVWAPWDVDPLVRVEAIQRLAVAVADTRGIDADAPRNLTRSVELKAGR